jgi:hypothetical protein
MAWIWSSDTSDPSTSDAGKPRLAKSRAPASIPGTSIEVPPLGLDCWEGEKKNAARRPRFKDQSSTKISSRDLLIEGSTAMVNATAPTSRRPSDKGEVRKVVMLPSEMISA